MTLNGGPSSCERIAGVAGFEVEDEIAAIDRYGSNAVVGFAISQSQLVLYLWWWQGHNVSPATIKRTPERQRGGSSE